jgi:hypothetical protein
VAPARPANTGGLNDGRRACWTWTSGVERFSVLTKLGFGQAVSLGDDPMDKSPQGRHDSRYKRML